MLMMHNGGIKHVKAILNLLITNGERITGSRYLYQSRSLHFADGSQFECKNNKYILKDDSETEQRAVLIVSEKLNKQDQEWKDIPANHFFTVNQTGNLKFTFV